MSSNLAQPFSQPSLPHGVIISFLFPPLDDEFLEGRGLIYLPSTLPRWCKLSLHDCGKEEEQEESREGGRERCLML